MRREQMKNSRPSGSADPVKPSFREKCKELHHTAMGPLTWGKREKVELSMVNEYRNSPSYHRLFPMGEFIFVMAKRWAGSQQSSICFLGERKKRTAG